MNMFPQLSIVVIYNNKRVRNTGETGRRIKTLADCKYSVGGL